MKNENIKINETNRQNSPTDAPEALTANEIYGTISSSDSENGTAELVLIPPFDGDADGISVACVEGDDSSCDVASQTDILINKY